MTGQQLARSGTDRIAAAFESARDEGRAALVVYFTAGYPTRQTSAACFEAAAEAGADLLEIGLPFSDPMMDGPTIQAANQAVLDAGMSLTDQLAVASSLQHLDAPRVAMGYVTVADTRGYARFADEVADAGISGVILPDLPVAEAAPWLTEAQRRDLATVFLASSVSTDARLDEIVERSTGWIYATGILGVTGVNAVAGDVTRELVGRVKARTSTPVAVGIGVKDRASAAEVATYADGVIVGSSVIRAAAEGDPAGAPGRVAALVRELRAGIEDAAARPAV